SVFHGWPPLRPCSPLFPYTTLFRSVVGPLLSAAGVSHAEPALFVMPDDARLDSFPEFKRMLGQVEERPTVDPEEDVGFEGAEKIDRKSTRLNSSHGSISYAVFCLKK